MLHIVTDTTACLPDEYTRANNIPVIPQIINFGNDSFREGIDITGEQFLQKLKSAKELPKTAAPAPEWFVEEFQRLVPQGGAILCIHPSADVSGTVRSALVAKNEFPDADIRVIDSRNVASGLGSMVRMAVDWRNAGVDPNVIVQRLEKLAPRARTYFMVDSLEFLSRGGRIGGAAALLGSLLQIKPILLFKDGKIDQFEKERTHRRAVIRLKQLAFEQCDPAGYAHLAVLHAGELNLAREIASDLARQLRIAHIPVYDMPPAIVTHAGPGILGVSFFTAE